MTPTVALFGSARIGPRDTVYQRTERAAKLLAEYGICVSTGGGPGLMEAANKGAASVCTDNVCSLGYSIFLPFEAETNEFVQHDTPHQNFHTRLQQFCQDNDGFIALPGGYGTLLEIMVVVQLLQVKHMDKPLILVGPMWRDIMSSVSRTLERHHLIGPGERQLWEYAQTPEAAATMMIEKLGLSR